MQRSLVRLSHEILERHNDSATLLMAGIRTRGAPLAGRISGIVAELCGSTPAVCAVDVSAFRDDRPQDEMQRIAAVSSDDGRPAEVAARTVILVDDVLFTGRTVRAAIDALMSQGRPQAVEVLTLVDRGHRELPVRATYVGKNVPTSPDDRVRVRVLEVDGVDGAWLVPAGRA